MTELRKHQRFTSLALAKVSGEIGGEALLKDLSITGCRLEFTTPIAPKTGEHFKLLIFPEIHADIEPFEIAVEARWNRLAVDSFEVGYSILASPKGKAFIRYLDYLEFRAKHHQRPVN